MDKKIITKIMNEFYEYVNENNIDYNNYRISRKTLKDTNNTIVKIEKKNASKKYDAIISISAEAFKEDGLKIITDLKKIDIPEIHLSIKNPILLLNGYYPNAHIFVVYKTEDNKIELAKIGPAYCKVLMEYINR